MDRKPVLTASLKQWALLLLMGVLAAYTFVKVFPPEQRVAIDPQSIAASQGHGYYAAVKLSPGFGYSVLSDSNEEPNASKVVLHEDARALGPAHSNHAEIFAVGAGRYSHWDGNVIFSASDNSDPRTSGHSYAVRLTMVAPAWMNLVAAMVAFAVLWLSRADRLARRSLTWLDRPNRLASAAMILLLALGLAFLFRPAVTQTIAPDSIKPSEGFGYTAPAPTLDSVIYTLSPDTSARPRVSSLLLIEDGTQLGPAHAAHAAIRSSGGGGFSHWGATIVFSASDGSDPRSNGRAYIATARAELSVLFWLPMMIGIALLGGRAVMTHPSRSAILDRLGAWSGPASLALAGGAAMLALHDIWSASGFYPVFWNDSDDYLIWPAQRGYLLKAILETGQATGLGPWWLVGFNFSIFALGSFTLGWAVGRACRSAVMGWLTTAALFANVELLGMLAGLLSEPVFLALVMVYMAFALESLRSNRVRDFVIAATAAALAILVRPAGYGLVIGLVLVVLLVRPWSMVRVLTGAVAFATVIIAGVIPNLVNKGIFATHTVGGLAVLGHVVQFADKSARYDDPELAAAVIEATQGRSTAATASWPHEYWRRTTGEYNTLLWGSAVPAAASVISTRTGEPVSEPMSSAMLIEVDIGLRKMATTIIFDHPVAYGRHVLAHVYGMWTTSFRPVLPLGRAIGERAEVSANLVTANPALQRFVGAPSYPPPGISERWERARGLVFGSERLWDSLRPVLRLTLVPLAGLTLGACFWLVVRLAFRRKIGLWTQAFAFCSVQLWVYMSLVAMAQPALARYSAVAVIMMLPAIALLLSAGFGWLWGRVASLTADRGRSARSAGWSGGLRLGSRHGSS